MYISMYYWGVFEKLLLSHRSNNSTYSECVSVALVIQQAKRTRCIILSYVACLNLPYFSMLSQKMARLSEKKVIEHIMCYDFLYNFCLKHFSFYK